VEIANLKNQNIFAKNLKNTENRRKTADFFHVFSIFLAETIFSVEF